MQVALTPRFPARFILLDVGALQTKVPEAIPDKLTRIDHYMFAAGVKRCYIFD